MDKLINGEPIDVKIPFEFLDVLDQNRRRRRRRGPRDPIGADNTC
jgi:hypothetical protein